MKATTKFQIEITDLAKKLSPITNAQLTWAKKQCLEHNAVVTKKGLATCLDCSHEHHVPKQDEKNPTYICPGCKANVKKIFTLKRNFTDWAYFSILQTINGNQVIRNFKIDASYTKKQKASIYCKEVCQLWLNENGKYEIFGMVHLSNYYYDTWTGDFEIRNKNTLNKYNITPYKIYPKIQLLDKLKRAGIKGRTYDVPPLYLFQNVLTNHRYETLLKSNYNHLISKLSSGHINEYWDSIKICIRNNYKITEPKLWIDYLYLLKKFNRDLRNSKYVCPKDLKEQHDILVKRRQKQLEKEYKIAEENRKREREEKIGESQQKYIQRIKNFLDLNISKNNIEISVIPTVQDFQRIGKEKSLCIFTNEYYETESSLMLIAKINGLEVEVIEISLENFKILEAQGYKNKPSEHHEEIIKLVDKNKHLIEKLAIAS